jgi:hypothetical protein
LRIIPACDSISADDTLIEDLKFSFDGIHQGGGSERFCAVTTISLSVDESVVAVVT